MEKGGMKMNEESTLVDSSSNRRKGYRKKHRKPITERRQEYLRENPAINTRVRLEVKNKLSAAAAAAGLKEADYVTQLIEGADAYINKIKNDAFEEGQRSRDEEIKQAYDKGLKNGYIADAQKILDKGIRQGQQMSAIYLKCANYNQCGQFVPLEAESELAMIAVYAVERERVLCPHCAFNQRIRKIFYEPPKPPRPSFWPVGYKW